MLPPLKLYILQSLLKQTRSLDGAVLEAGVWNGGSALLMAGYLDSIGSTKHLWLLDTFEGYDIVDDVKDGALAQRGLMRGKSVDEVKAAFSKTRTTVHIVKGAIPETLCNVHVSEISFAHIDVNLYEPTRRATEFCLERMPRGGIIVFDDYGWPATYGARQAIDEVCAAFGQETISIPESSQAFLIRN
jgi:O-methyltransferase